MGCSHDGKHDVTSVYDRRDGILVYFWICADCGTRLHEVRRERYRPRYNPRGNDGFYAAAR